MVLSLLWLAAASGSTSIEGIFLQYGLIGAVALALGLYSRSAIKSTEERAQRLEEDNRRLYQLMAEQFVPALTKAAQAIADATEVMAEIRKRDEYSRAAIKSTEERAQRLEEDNRRLYQLMAEQFVPALTKAAQAVADSTEIMAEIRKRDDIHAALQAARKPHGDE